MHGFKETHIELHDDGSATIHHMHHAGPDHDVKYAVQDLDGIHDGLEHHLGEPNDGEEAENSDHPSHAELLQEIESLIHKMGLADKADGE